MHRRFLANAAVISLLFVASCSESNPKACVNNPSLCKAGTHCVSDKDKQGRVWSACVLNDGGEGPESPESGVGSPADGLPLPDAGGSSDGIAAGDAPVEPSVDAPA